MRYRVRATTRTVLLMEGHLVIGRSLYCSLSLEDATVSRLHAMLRMTDEGLELSDLGSSCGTFVNGKRLTEAAIVTPDDEIRVGRQPLVIEEVMPRGVTATMKSGALDPDDLPSSGPTGLG